MLKVFLSYSHADGAEHARRPRLTARGGQSPILYP